MSHSELEIKPHAAGEGFDRAEPKSGMIAGLAGVLIGALLLVLFGVQAFYEHSRQQQVYEKVLAPVGEDLTALRAKEDAQLHSYGYIDRGKGVVRLPIERAMELMEKEYAAGGKVYYSAKPTEVKPPEPATPAAGAPAAAGTGTTATQANAPAH